jgi:hypothetical protein
VHRQKEVAEKSALNTIASCIHAWAECNGEIAERSFGVALMTNADGAPMLIAELLACLFRAYGQDLFLPVD